ncbi:MAG: PfkB family carbohydrate kinase [Pseudomonadota bacterium]
MTGPVTDFNCVGGAHWDIIGRADGPVRAGDDVPGRIEQRPGGVALNVALGPAERGCAVRLCAVVGDDEAGRSLVIANNGSSVWADSAYRSKKNEAFVDRVGLVSHIHRRRRPGKPMPPHIRRGNATRPKHRAPVEHVFAVQKQAMALTIRTIGLARAKTKIGIANIAYNIRRLVQIRRAETA